jgi:hypothetical protein
MQPVCHAASPYTRLLHPRRPRPAYLQVQVAICSRHFRAFFVVRVVVLLGSPAALAKLKRIAQFLSNISTPSTNSTSRLSSFTA